MYRLTLSTGVILTILGILAYMITGMQSVTALIPTLFGLVIFVLGLLAKRENLHKHMMHAALIIALLGLVGSFSGIPATINLLGSVPVERPAAAISKAMMSVICLVYLIAGIRSFILARRKPVNS